jgi:Flp pilus assembly protein TadD
MTGALEMSQRALALAPSEPRVLNNHCYILYSADRAVDALPFCERAVIAAPDAPEVRHSLASVYAALGRCEEAEGALGEARRLDPATVEYQRAIACVR